MTGASSGIGEGVARHLAACGAAVVINYHSEAKSAQKIVDDIKAANGEAIAIQADVSAASDNTKAGKVRDDFLINATKMRSSNDATIGLRFWREAEQTRWEVTQKKGELQVST